MRVSDISKAYDLGIQLKCIDEQIDELTLALDQNCKITIESHVSGRFNPVYLHSASLKGSHTRIKNEIIRKWQFELRLERKNIVNQIEAL